MALAENIAEFRKARGMTQNELAEQIDVKQCMVSKYENGKKLPSVDKLIQLANTLDCSMDMLCGRKEDDSDGQEV